MLEIIWAGGVWLFALSLICSGTVFAGVCLLLLLSWWRQREGGRSKAEASANLAEAGETRDRVAELVSTTVDAKPTEIY